MNKWGWTYARTLRDLQFCWLRLGTGQQFIQFHQFHLKKIKTTTMTTLHLRQSIGRLPLRLGFLLIPLTLGCFALSPTARAVTPAPDCAPNFNARTGCHALYELTTGVGNAALGWHALAENSDASFSTGIGAGALSTNNGESNTAVGAAALLVNSAGTENTAVGTDALALNDTGESNTAAGAFALFNNIDGINNVAIGREALLENTSGAENTAVGTAALSGVTTGGFNTAIGGIAGANLTTGQFNIVIGDIAGLFVTTASNTICIGGSGINTDNTCQIAHIRDVTTQNNDAIPVVVDSAGQLGTLSSSGRFKKDVKPMDKASEALFALKPVTFHYKTDKTNRAEFGLIAEEVAKINPDLVVPDESRKIYTVRYEAVNAMLLNEFLKEHREVQELKKQIAALTAGLQEVSAQLEVSKPARRTVLNNQ
jgi:Chaperone of endosialidase